MDGKAGRCVTLTTLPLSRADRLEIRELQPPGLQQACTGGALPMFCEQRLNIRPFDGRSQRRVSSECSNKYAYAERERAFLELQFEAKQ